MKIKRIILLLSIINFNTINSQGYEPFKSGEWLKYKISYSGWLKAGEATMSIKSDTMDDTNKRPSDYAASVMAKDEDNDECV